MAERTIPAPPSNPEVQPFFDAAKQGKLLVKRCAACNEFHHYPRAICPFCGSDRTEWSSRDPLCVRSRGGLRNRDSGFACGRARRLIAALSSISFSVIVSVVFTASSGRFA